MDHDGISQDVHALAGRFPHRASNTESEREAAEYVQQRMRASAPDTMHDPFDSIDSWRLLFAAYYGEFLVVSLLAGLFHPFAGFGYGTVVFVLYLAEFTGYHLLTRFLPQYASQNVMGRIMASRPQRLVVVTAHYDTGASSWLTRSDVVPWLRWIHIGLVILMVAVLVTCAADGILDLTEAWQRAVTWVRWLSAGLLAISALLLLLDERRGVHTRGGVDNASGVAAMLALGRRLRDDPVDTTEVLLLATGSSTVGLNGMHHFLRHQDLDRELTYFLNFDQVGSGQLAYTTAEGMLHAFGSSREWLAIARATAAEFDARAFRLTAFPGDMLIPLARGYHAMSIMGVDPSGLPVFWQSDADHANRVDVDQVDRAARFGEQLIRELDAAR